MMKIKGATIHRVPLKTRMPFKYGIATMTEVPMVFVKLETEVGGQDSWGISSDLLPPKWFTKVPDDPLEKEISDMLQVIRKALAHAVGLDATSAFAAWKQIHDQQDAWAQSEGIAPLLAHFGVSLAERALIESSCRALGKPLWQALRDGDLGFDPGAIHPELAGCSVAKFLPDPPLASVQARHTIGLADPLSENDIPADEKLDDGLPQSLDQCIQAYGLRHFKIKNTGNLDEDLERLRKVAATIKSHASSDHAFSLDGNEQFQSVEAFREHWDKLSAQSDLDEFFRHLLFVEQPLHRAVALTGPVKTGFDAWPGRPPVIIDESDATLESLPRALELGYAGTSHKNCKGIFKGIANACLLEQRRQGGQTTVLSGEDLCNVGPVAVIQDLAVMGLLGIGSVERNGHHYMAGLSQFPETIQRQVLEAHTGLYKMSARGWPTLNIRNGSIDLSRVNSRAFGTGFDLDLSLFEPVSLRDK